MSDYQAAEQAAEIIAALEAENDKLKKMLVDLEAKYDNRPKLSARDVALIRRFGSTTGMSNRELAKAFGVNERTIGRTLEGVYHKGK
ncbi:hypothetical protein AB0G00_23800 [Nocardia salmonicida]|uniref:hypothetical protein n=1 Tax=Nocardia salmonicida TaxID=53431 RepID=UPI0033FAA77C